MDIGSRNGFSLLREYAVVRIVVFGAGAMGSFFGGMLASRHEVTLIGRPEHMRAIRGRGLRITGKTSRIARPRVATRIMRNLDPDLVFVTTKAYDTSSAMEHLRPFASRALFVTLQNGLENPDVIARRAARVVAGTTAHGVTYLGPGEVRHAGVGDTVLGPWRGVSLREVTRLSAVLEDAGIPTRVTGDVRAELWVKVIVNAAINPLAALAGVPNGRLARDRRLAAALDAVCRESAAVARAEGVALADAEIVRRALTVARRTASNRASMLQDLDRGRRTEIEEITGAIVRAAEAHGLPVPLNRCLHALVRAREAAQEGAS